eukprot:Nk52_evm15s1869 gene=Nk52_evmTU15s1869
MGGSKNKARVKGNAKPSSSAGAAQLLAARSGAGGSGGFGGGFSSGFGGVAGDDDDERDVGMDPEWTVSMGKLRKKDGTTKTKGLQELKSLIESKPVESVKLAYGIWPRLFNRLSIDVDVKVRELANVVMGAFGLKLKKGIATELKSLFANWYCNSFDISREVADAAKTSLNACFPNIVNVLKFHDKELMGHFENNLIRLKKEDLNSKYLGPTDISAQYERIVFCSLMGLANFVSTMEQEKHADRVEGIEKIACAKAFWKLSGKKSKPIRQAFFDAASCLFEVYPLKVSPHSALILPVVFNGLCEDNLSFIGNVWSALLHFLSKVPDPWASWTPNSSALTILFKFVKNAGYGSERSMYKSLLPLLSLISADIKFSSPWLFEMFFKSIKSSLNSEHFDKSIGDSSVELFSSFLECIKYSLFDLEKLENDKENKKLQRVLFLEIMPDFICFLVRDDCKLEKTRFNFAFDHFFIKLAEVTDFVCAKDKYKELANEFFAEIGRMFEDILFVDGQEGGRDLFVRALRVGEFYTRGMRFSKSGSSCALYNDCLTSSCYSMLKNTAMHTALSFKCIDQQPLLVCSYTLLFGELCSCADSLIYFEMLAETIERCFGLQTSGSRRNFLGATQYMFDCALSSSASSDNRHLIYKHIVLAIESFLRARITNKEGVKQMFTSFTVKYSVNYSTADLMLIFLKSFVKLSLEQASDVNEFDVECMDMLGLKIFQEWIPDNQCKGKDRARCIELLVYILTERLQASGMLSKPAYEHILCLFYQYIDDFLQGFGHPEFYKNFESQGTIVKELCDVLHIYFVRMAATSLEIPGPIVELLPFMFKLSVIELPCVYISSSSYGEDESKESVSERIKNNLSASAEGAWSVGKKLLLKSTSNEATQNKKQVMLNIIHPIKRAVLETDSIRGIEALVEQVVEVVSDCCTSQKEKQDAVEEALFNEEQWENAEVLLETCRDVLAIMNGSYTILTRSYGKNGICAQKNSELGLHTHTKFLVYTNGLVRGFGLNAFFSLDETNEIGNAGKARGWVLLKLLWCRAWLHNVYGYKHVEYRKSFFCEPLHEDLFEQCSYVESFLLQLVSELAARTNKVATQRRDGNSLIQFIGELVENAFKLSCGSEYVNCQVFGRVFKEVIKSGLWKSQDIEGFYSSYSGSLNVLNHNTLRTMQTILEALSFCETESVFVVDLMEKHLNSILLGSGLFGEEYSEGGAVGSLCIVNSCCLATSGLHEGTENEVLVELALNVLSHIRKWYTVGSELLQATGDRSVAAHLNVAIFCRQLLAHQSEQFSKDDWAFILARCRQWLGIEDPYDYLVTRALRYQTLLLINDAYGLIQKGEECQSVSALVKVWEVYEKEIFLVVFPLFLQESSYDSSYFSKLSHHMQLTALADVMAFMPRKSLLENPFVTELFECVYVRHADVQKRAFGLLYQLLETELAEPEINVRYDDSVNDVQDTSMVKHLAEESNEGRTPPKVLMAAIKKAEKDFASDGKFPSNLHVPVELSPSCEGLYSNELLEAFPFEERHLRFGYLLCWLLLFDCLEMASPRLRSHYVQYLGDERAMVRLLDIAFQHIPLSSRTIKEYNRSFILELNLRSLSLADQGEGFHRLCSHIFYRSLKGTPTLTRTWWNDLSRKMYVLIEKHTAKYFSPVLIEQEMIAVKESKTEKLDGIEVQASLSKGEVSAKYTIDEVSLGLVVKLAENHPMQNVKIESPYRAGLSESQWRKWLLQITLLLTAQNGSVIEALLMWKENIEKRFSGVEDCTICYAVIHGTNYSLPNLRCKTCKNRFHSACLFKWFQTSNNSTCPLCRNLF